jgi:hypothetical protein
VIFERFRRRELVRTNYLGASTKFDYGQIVERDGKRYRVTHQKLYRTTPWETIVISGVEVPDQEGSRDA